MANQLTARLLGPAVELFGYLSRTGQFAAIGVPVLGGTFLSITGNHPWVHVVGLLMYALAAYLSVALWMLNTRTYRLVTNYLAQVETGNWDPQPLNSVRMGTQGLVRQLGVQMTAVKDTVSSNVDSVTRGSMVINQRTAKLSASADEVAAMLEEAASGTEQFAATIEVGAQNCVQAQSKAQAVAVSAAQGVQNINELIVALGQTAEQSRHLTVVVSMIEEIANQTGMLALTAGIEAARAGDKGKGFSVVASEIRELSHRSTEAAREIKTLLSSARLGMREATQLAAKVQNQIEQITHNVQLVSTTIADIATSSIEQQAGISQIKHGVEQMANLTQENAAAVEVVAREAMVLATHARSLDASLVDVGGKRFSNRNAVVQLANAARDHIQSVGMDQAIKDFNDPYGNFRPMDLFVIITDSQANTHCHPVLPNLVGTNGLTVIDKADAAVFVDAAKESERVGSAWCEYTVVNPITGNRSRKLNYFVSIPNDKRVIAVGLYVETAKTA